jgi:hypothetical protein
VKNHGHTCKFYLNYYFLWQSFWIWQWIKILRLYWDKCWNTLCRIL